MPSKYFFYIPFPQIVASKLSSKDFSCFRANIVGIVAVFGLEPQKYGKIRKVAKFCCLAALNFSVCVFGQIKSWLERFVRYNLLLSKRYP